MSQPDVYGIFGHPVSHSRSPRMQNAAFRACGLLATYVAFEVAPENLPAALIGARAMGIKGLNITLPHKEAVIPLLDVVDATARTIGAVNTVTCEGGRLLGSNTDAAGLARSLREGGVDLRDKRVLILGAGGAVRAAVMGLAEAGAAAITVAARRPEAADQLATSLVAAVGPTALDACPMTDMEARFAACDVLVQGTSATLGDPARAAAFAHTLPIDALPDHAVVTDLVYEPRITSVLARAQDRGLSIVDGSGMLIHQGALAFERWTGQAAPIEVMRKAFWNEEA